MKRQVSMFLILLILTSCRDKSAQQAVVKQRMENNELIKLLAEKNGAIIQFKSQLQGVQNKLQAIKLQEEAVLGLSGQTELTLKKESLESDLGHLGKLLLFNKKEIESLQTTLSGLHTENKALKLQLEVLQENNDHQIDQLNMLLALLTERDIRINTLEQVNSRIKEHLSSFSEDAQRVHYLMGDKKEFRELGVAKRGILSALNNPRMKADFDKGIFLVDKESDFLKIQIPSEKVRILSLHPSESSEVEESRSGSILRITDVDKFWSITKYLTILKI